MEKLRAAFRLFVAFVLGVVVGVMGIVVVINSGHEIGDSVIRGAPLVKALESDLDDARSHRDSVTRRFEQLGSKLENVERRYGDLGRRLELIEGGLRRMEQARSLVPAEEATQAPQPPQAETFGVR